ncbi:hypothetical protein IJ102_00125 [Candidatus Saccharibacteria bacterium]|nr:hypothetical protein [Candidatus Saccharibacteria bacterium]
MKRKIAVSVLAVFFALVSAQASYARDLSDEEQGVISQTCASIQLQLKNIQKTDSKNRVTLGSYYETVNTNLMLSLNVRLVKNNRANADLTTMQTNFAQEREIFKTVYTDYQRELDVLIATDCREKPQEFYNELEKVRTKRAKVHSSVGRLRNILTQHRQAVVKLQEAF